jgi:hypothetical protein
MKYKRMLKRTTKQYIIVACICIIVIGGAAIFTSLIMTSQIRNEYRALLEKANQDIKMNQRNVFVAIKDIAPGEYLTKENVERQTVYASQPKETYILEDSLGKAALIAIPNGTNIMNSMVTDKTVSSELREMEFDVINIGSNIANNDSVDIRIFYPNGESYVVLSKKVMKGLVPDITNCLLWLDEEEHLRISAAIVDAGMYAGSKLYVTKYIEPNIQEASKITYTPSLSILSLIESDPNIVQRYSQQLNIEIRKALENRLASSIAMDVTTINWDIKTNNHFITSTVQPTSQTSSTEDTPEPTKALPPQTASVSEAVQSSDLGNIPNYLYYAEEDAAKEGEIEYGE